MNLKGKLLKYKLYQEVLLWLNARYVYCKHTDFKIISISEKEIWIKDTYYRFGVSDCKSSTECIDKSTNLYPLLKKYYEVTRKNYILQVKARNNKIT